MKEVSTNIQVDRDPASQCREMQGACSLLLRIRPPMANGTRGRIEGIASVFTIFWLGEGGDKGAGTRKIREL